MWPPWGKTYRRSPSRNFSFSTFKDVISLVNDEKPGPPPQQDEKSPLPTSKLPSVFHRVRTAASAIRSWRNTPPTQPPKRVVLYFTSLRVIRRTFDDCNAVRAILKGLRLSIDERDLSMHAAFLDELKAILGQEELITLPRVFIGDRCIGGADEIRQMHETGELKKVVEGVAWAWPGECESCGGLGFVLCSYCNGSHKYHVEKGVYKSCSFCNENGLVRCTFCC